MTAQELKNAILQLAIQGKLVAQCKDDDSTSELLKQIIAIRNQIEKKHIKSLSSVSEEEISFEIPESWILLRLGDFCQVYNGNSINATVKQEKYSRQCDGYSFIATKDLGFDHIIDYDNGIYIPKEETGFKIASAGSILLCMEGGSAGKKIGILDRDVCFGNKLCCFTPYVIDNQYLYYYLQSPVFFSDFFASMTGLIGGVGSAKLKNILCPIPPLAEQKRIVERIEELMPLIEEYGKAEEELSKLNAEFPDKLRKSILQQAVQGKLTERDPADEPVSELLKRIKAQKEVFIKSGQIKKEKLLPVITDDEKPFDIPATWEWVRLGEVILLTSGTDLTPDKYNASEEGVPYITGASNFMDSKLSINRWTQYPTSISNKGELLITCKGTIGEMAINDIGNIHIARQVMSIRELSVQLEYIRVFLSSYLSTLKSVAKSMIPGISRTDILHSLIPIPPLNEQKRIVKRVEELLALCDELK